MNAEAAEVWRQVVSSMPAGWFGPEVWPTLAQYCYHAVEARRIARMIEACDPRRDLDRYEKLLRLQRDQTSALKALGSSLRISPQARIQPRSAGRAYENSRGARPWETDT